jgi:hypothetical protein
MSQGDEPADGFFGAVGVAVAMALCCAGLPLVLGAGIALGVVGIAAGSALIVVAGGALAVWAWQHRKNADVCNPPGDRPRCHAPRPHGSRSQDRSEG